MDTHWKKKSQEDIKSIVFKALEENVNYDNQNILGIPASYLDDKVFNQDDAFVKQAPFISSLIQNPNHIGCHTLGKSESFFQGTQDIEKNLIEICAVDILNGESGKQDGYIASGGTEANIQAIWIYRNYFINEHAANREDICIICSEDSHYSMDKAANLLVLDIYKVPVDNDTREIKEETIREVIQECQNQNKKYFIVICNMMTTMFGSVDKVEAYTNQLTDLSCEFKLHVDGAYGGFYYPFIKEDSQLTFKNQHISSFTLDAHKMAQAPYGTGVFLIRKGYMQNVNTQQASYVEGEDYTLIGSRSGANAIAVWMILVKNGPFGWQEKVFILQKRTEWMCNQLNLLNIEYFRHPMSNIITIRSKYLNQETTSKFGLVPDNHAAPNWFKIVIMDHVTIEKLVLLIEDIKSSTPSDNMTN
ncbi:pyridoxal phosphate-dependent decarboxylase family protein [Psychroserpens jangbogonensis]|uniref:pyridoxal phosphate-dependent decarboxylase family protein n=1 Tax=Psychroserpens jangbogonensis TaxID=1484460 RepID=UPI00053DBE35|nr:pyridoxal-dependent decarboxylase [Psychroserpens jangbogonensis]